MKQKYAVMSESQFAVRCYKDLETSWLSKRSFKAEHFFMILSRPAISDNDNISQSRTVSKQVYSEVECSDNWRSTHNGVRLLVQKGNYFLFLIWPILSWTVNKLMIQFKK